MKILVTPRSFGKNNPELFDILRDAGLDPLTNTEEAVQRAVDIAAGRA